MYPCPTDGLICLTAHEQVTIDFLFRGPGSGLRNCAMQLQQNGSHSGPEAKPFAVSGFVEFESPHSTSCVVADDCADGHSGSCAKRRHAPGTEKDC